MGKTWEEYLGWIKKAEQEAAANPSAYRRKVGLFAMAGYAYIFTLLGVAVACLVGLGAFVYFRESGSGSAGIFKIAIALVVFCWAIVTAMWVTFEPPAGRRVTRKEFPRLFDELDDLTKKLRTIPVHEVIVVPECNAFVAQTPRLGILGWHRNSLGLGLELMLVLNPQEMRAVIAHELGHLSGNHGKFSGWIYRVRKTWSNLNQKFNEREWWGRAIIDRFFRWYAPRFAAYSFALSRQDEYEADSASAELTSPLTAAEALTKCAVFGGYLQGIYWSRLAAQADHHPQPQQMAYAALADQIQTDGFDRDGLDYFRKLALDRSTDYDDTHPCLTDRLSALGFQSGPNIEPPGLYHSAAHEWFGEGLWGLIEEMDREWWQNVEPRWTTRYEKVQCELSELNRLRGLHPNAVEQMELWRLGSLTAKYSGEPDALPVFRAYQQAYPDDFDAALVIGRLLRNLGNDACVTEWARVPPMHSAYVDANSEAAQFLDERGRRAEAERFWMLARERHDELRKVEEDNSSISLADTLVKPHISKGNREYLRSRLKGLGFIAAAWVAQKEVKQSEGMPIYVVAYEWKWAHLKRWTHLDPEQAGQEAVLETLASAYTKEEPMHLFVTRYRAVLGGKLGKKVKRVGVRIL